VIEAALFESREFATATIALFAFFVAFAIFLLITVLYLQDLWHYSALRTGLAIAPGPLASACFAINAWRIIGRFGRARPAIAGASLTACSALFFLLLAPAHPDFLTGFLPGMLLGGAGAGLIQAPLFAAASTLPAHRSTTGSAVLNMARQVGSAVGVAALVAVLATEHPDRLSLFRRGWAVELTAAAAAAAVIALSRRGGRRQSAGRRSARGRAEDLVQRGEIVLGGLPAPGADVGAHLLGLGRAGDDRGHGLVCEQRADGDVGQRDAALVGEVLEAGDQLELLIAGDLVAAREPGALGTGLPGTVLAGQQPGGEREEGDEGDTKPPAGGQHLALGLAN
jgi:MFS family permease